MTLDLRKVSIPEKREIPFEVSINKHTRIVLILVSIPEKREIPFEDIDGDYIMFNMLVSIPEKREIPFEALLR